MINFAWPRNPATLDELFAQGTQAARPSVFPLPHVPMPHPVSRFSAPKNGPANAHGTMEEATEYALGQSVTQRRLS